MIGPSASGGGGPRDDDRIPVMSSQLALRVAIVGSVALLMFAVIFLRLWFLQVLTGNQAVASARGNITRKVPVAAPRGSILADDGSVLVDSVKVPAVLIEPQELPVGLTANKHGVSDPVADQRIYSRLAGALNLRTTGTCKYSVTVETAPGTFKAKKFSPRLAEIPCIIAQHNADIETGTITIATHIPVAEQAYISERQAEFKGVEVTRVSVSEYPDRGLAAQLLGNIGANSSSSSKTGKLFDGVKAYDEVGQTGLEYQYNKYLQGTDGYQRIEVNAEGQYAGQSTPVSPKAGFNLKTSIDPALQRVGQNSLQESIDRAGTNDGGAFVAMNPENGQVYAMGSLPTFDPNIFQKPLTQTEVNRLYSADSGDPSLNRAIQSVGPTGSTFKIITATAALEAGKWTPGETFDDTGQYCPTPNDPASCIHNSSHEVGGVINMETAFEKSDDVFFYNLGDVLNVDPFSHPQGGQLQTWAKMFGIGQRPKIDLPYAVPGTLPTPARTEALISAEEQCDAGTGDYRYTDGASHYSKTPQKGYHRTAKQAAGACGIAELPNAGWTVGDNINTGVGQGDVQASPLQLAMAYSAIANGGRLVTPHIGKDVQTTTGQVVSTIKPGPERKLKIDPTYLQTIQTGLRLAASGPSGTSTDVMGSFKMPVYGKTGTAQYFTSTQAETDYAWYACYVPASATSKPITVVVWVEKGGFGDQTAAPVARQILNQWFYNTPGAFATGSSTAAQGL